MKGCEKMWLKLGIASLLLLLYGFWHGYITVGLVTALFLAICLVGLYAAKREGKLFNHDPSFNQWLYSHEKELEGQGLDSLFCIFIESTSKGLYHAVLDYEFLDELYESMLKEMRNHFGTNHVKRLSREQFVVVKDFPSADTLDPEQRQLYQQETAIHLSDIFEDLIHGCDERVGKSIEVTIGCASGGIRYRVNRIEELLELAYFAMKSARDTPQRLKIADEHTRARKYDIDECKFGFCRNAWEDEFNPFFQPIVNPISFSIVGVESVARWQLGGFRVIPASVFKDLAYEMNRIRRIDAIIVTKTFSAVKELKEEGIIPYGFKIVVNMGAVSLEGSSTWLSDLAEEYSLHPEHIEIDIRDSVLTDPAIVESIHQLRKKGFRIALDAFDEQSFDLKAFFSSNFDTIKLDYSLSKDEENPLHWQGRKIYDSLVSMADSLEIETLAKNIETRFQLEYAKKQGVDHLQGNYFTPPIPLPEFKNFMNKYREGLYLDAYVGATELA